MTVTVRLFAILRERAGRDSIEIELDEGATVADALDELSERPELERAAGADAGADGGQPRLRGSRHRACARRRAGPGPAGQRRRRAVVHVRVTEEPLSLDVALAGWSPAPRPGAIVTFQGTTRDVDRLDYEAYRGDGGASGSRRSSASASSATGWRPRRPSTGSAPFRSGESSVIVSVSAAHREEAFAGAREAIDRIKAEAPIWKREVEATAEGETGRWVEGAAPPTRARARCGRGLERASAPRR